jgi:hypothetical protein
MVKEEDNSSIVSVYSPPRFRGVDVSPPDNKNRKKIAIKGSRIPPG